MLFVLRIPIRKMRNKKFYGKIYSVTETVNGIESNWPTMFWQYLIFELALIDKPESSWSVYSLITN